MVSSVKINIRLDMSYHPVVEQLISLLNSHECDYTTFEHKSVRTSEEAAAIRPDYTLHQGAKALIMRAKEKGGKKYFLMLVFPADKKFSSQKVKILMGLSDIRFATEDEVSDLTNGVKVGGVPPFGNIFGLKVVADPDLFGNEKIIFNAGDKSFSISMMSKDYRKIVKPTVLSIIDK